MVSASMAFEACVSEEIDMRMLNLHLRLQTLL